VSKPEIIVWTSLLCRWCARFASRNVHFFDWLSVSRTVHSFLGDLGAQVTFRVNFEDLDCRAARPLFAAGMIENTRSDSGLRHSLHPHFDEPSADVGRIESHTTADTKAGNRPPFCSTENRQSRDFQMTGEFLGSHSMVNCIDARG
jgi:hypothetical protein